MRKPLIAGNWKMNKSQGDLATYFKDLCAASRIDKKEIAAKVDVLIAAPYTMLQKASELCEGKNITIASQNVHFEASGAFTGEISIPMLLEVGVRAAVIGHSERRQFYGETDSSVAQKVKVCLEKSVMPIACVGETREEREAGKTKQVVSQQLIAIMKGLSEPKNLVIAYEPVWAIGTGLTATNMQAQEVHHLIRILLADQFGKEAAEKIRILYGGSAKPDNIAGLLGEADIDGALIGGASLKAADLAAMVVAAAL